MKKLLIALAFFPLLLNAQSLIGGKNIFKTNLTSYAFGCPNLTYERHIAPHLTLSVGVNDMPKRGLPFQNTVQNLFSSSYIDYAHTQVSNLSITPELRFYVLGGMRGFYIAPYVRFSTLDMDVPLHYSTEVNGNIVTKDATFTGKITSTSGGLLLGTQHQLFKKVVIDIWILGGHYGSCSGNLLATYTPQDPNNAMVTALEKQTLQTAINSLDPSPFKVSGTVSKTAPSADIKVSGPWVGIRALGINVGIRF